MARLSFLSRLNTAYRTLMGTSGATYSLRDPALVNLFGGHQVESGVTVTEFTAINSAAVFSAVRLISEGVAALPLILYRRKPDGGKEKAFDHPLYHILHNYPCPNVPALNFRETLQAHCELWGNAYAEIERNSLGEVVRLWILRPDWMFPRLDESGHLYYEYRHPDIGKQTFTARDIFHIRNLGFDGLVGHSTVKVARESLGLTVAQERFAAKLFGSGARPSGVLQHPGTLSDDAARRLKNDFERSHAGIDNAHRIAVLEEGMVWNQTTIPPEDAQFLESRQFQIQEVARWFNLPLAKLRTALAPAQSAEDANQEFVTDCLRPKLIKWEQEIAEKLLQPWERQCYFAEHNCDSILRANQSTRYNSYAIGRNWGWLSVNDIRQLENLDPIPGGDVYLQPLNMQPINAPRGPSAPTTTPDVGLAPQPVLPTGNALPDPASGTNYNEGNTDD